MRAPEPRTAWSRRTLFAAALTIASWLVFFALPAIPFLPLGTAERAWLAGADLVVAYALWWLAVALAGPELVRRLRPHPRRWYLRARAALRAPRQR